ncbi:hypothetical protein [Nocardioides sp. zg-DK7169]|uniref:hypothetical protein n=1 Tax=Nocardioides sp. zg-DK7169 TaxID=2736600 RepID=UPI0015526B5B|nr:hypothetical protein [Nocardioides sp. zg-DK7169]NPC96758.1 hypothetical protein [Nocardioides sp. zg-DK7169]
MGLRSMLVAVALCAAAVACASEDASGPRTDPEAPSAAPKDVFPVGAIGAFGIYPHCGVEFTLIDGMLWRTTVPPGSGNPQTWPVGAFRGTLSRPAVDLAIYTSPLLPVTRLVFRPAPDASHACA